MADATVKLGYDDSSVQQGLKKTQGAATNFATKTEAALNRVKSAGSSLRGVLGVGLGIVGLDATISGFKALVEEGAKFTDIATKLGTSTESVQRLNNVASKGGVEFEKVVGSVTKLKKALATVEGREVIQGLGMDVERLRKLAPERQIIELAGALEEAGDSGGGLNGVYKLLGDSAADLLPLLRSSRGELEEWARIDVNTEAAVAGLDNLSEAMESVKNALSKNVAGGLGDVINGIMATIESGLPRPGETMDDGSTRGINKVAGDIGAKNTSATNRRIASEKKAAAEELARLEKSFGEERDKTSDQELTTAEKLTVSTLR